MERKLIVSLLQKNIQELGMITEGFMEMTEYPAAIIQLARNKTKDIFDYITQLEAIKNEDITSTYVPEQISPDKEEEKVIDEDKKELPEESLDVVEKENISLDELIIESAQEEEIIENEMETPQFSEEEPEENTEKEEQENESPEVQQEDLEKTDVVEAYTNEITVTLVEEEKEPVGQQEVAPEPALVDKKPETSIEEVLTKQTAGNDDNTIAGLHSNKKIDDIRHAISIGDRFRFQRELFDGNGELLNKTLAKLNQMNDFEEAACYLHSKFKWNEEDETVESFYMIVKRRYL